MLSSLICKWTFISCRMIWVWVLFRSLTVQLTRGHRKMTLERNQIFLLFLAPSVSPVLGCSVLWLSPGANLVSSCRFGPYKPLPFQNKNEWRSLVAVLLWSSWTGVSRCCVAGHFQLSLLKVSEKLQVHASNGEDGEKVHTRFWNFNFYYF